MSRHRNTDRTRQQDDQDRQQWNGSGREASPSRNIDRDRQADGEGGWNGVGYGNGSADRYGNGYRSQRPSVRESIARDEEDQFELGQSAYEGFGTARQGMRGQDGSPRGRGVGQAGYAQEGYGTRGFGRDGQHDVRNGTARGPHSGKGPKGWQRSDERLRDEISEALARHAHLDASEIEIEVQGGNVTLTGTVSDRQEKRLAEDLADDVSGVQNVENRLRVGSAGTSATAGTSSTADARGKSGRSGGASSPTAI